MSIYKDLRGWWTVVIWGVLQSPVTRIFAGQQYYSPFFPILISLELIECNNDNKQ